MGFDQLKIGYGFDQFKIGYAYDQFSIGWGYDQFLLVILGNSTLTDQKKLVKFTILNWLKIQPIMYWSK